MATLPFQTLSCRPFYWQACPGSPVLAVLSWQSCPGSPVLDWQSFPVLVSWMSCSRCPSLFAKLYVKSQLENCECRISDIGNMFNPVSNRRSDSSPGQSSIGGSDIRLNPISFITGIGLSTVLMMELFLNLRRIIIIMII
jgi:hypothetical protein